MCVNEYSRRVLVFFLFVEAKTDHKDVCKFSEEQLIY